MLLQDYSDWVSWTRAYLFVVFILILFVGSSILLLKARKIEFETARKILRGYAMFGICFAFTRIFFMFSSYDQYVNGTGSYWSSVWGVTAYAITMVSIVFVFSVVERYILKIKPIFATIALVSVGIDVLALIMILAGLNFPFMAPKDLALQVQNYVAPVLGVVILVLYIVVIKNSVGDIRRKAVITFIGVVLILLSILFDATFMNKLLESLSMLKSFMTPMCGIAGVLLVFYSIK